MIAPSRGAMTSVTAPPFGRLAQASLGVYAHVIQYVFCCSPQVGDRFGSLSRQPRCLMDRVVVQRRSGEHVFRHDRLDVRRADPGEADPGTVNRPVREGNVRRDADGGEVTDLAFQLQVRPPARGPDSRTRTAVITSFGASAVVNGPLKNSSIGIVRVPSGPRASTSAPTASITEPQSPCGSACAIEPHTVPRLRTIGSEICGAA